VRLARGPLWHAARIARDWSLRAACDNVVIGARMRAHLAGQPGPVPRLTAIHNWADGDAIRPMDPQSSPLRSQWGLADRFVVAYAGNLGRVHEYATLLDVATVLRGDDRLLLLLVGQGLGFQRLRAEALREGLTNVEFRPPQPRERLGQLLALGDVHLVTLAPGMGAFVVPSKLYGVLAAGRPVVFVGGADSEIPDLLDEHGCGFSVPAGDAGSLARALRTLAADPALRERLGHNARRTFEERFAKPAALAAWWHVIAACSQREGSRSS
jgi:glycosyltransferase involved in cell wall biosynthesis